MDNNGICTTSPLDREFDQFKSPSALFIVVAECREPLSQKVT